MKGKNVVRIIVFTLLILFTTLYITQALGYYEYTNKKTNVLTEDAIKKFEKDVSSGKNIKAIDYVKKENDYNNKLSRSGIAISNLIEKTFDGIMNFLFNEIDKAISDS